MPRIESKTQARPATSLTQTAPPAPAAAGKAPASASPPVVAPSAPTPEQIRVRAYEIYVARGAQPGREVEDWEQAKRELANLAKPSAGRRA